MLLSYSLYGVRIYVDDVYINKGSIYIIKINKEVVNQHYKG
jgi:hypothetical protein